MKHLILCLAVGAFVAACGPPPVPEPSVTPTSATATPSRPPSASPGACEDFSHVYHPDRLKVLAPCVTLTGTIEVIRKEADGDDHILVRLDPGQDRYINAVNVSKQHGDLVAEPICENAVSQADAVGACAGVTHPTPVPPVGSHVAVTGPWVLDQQHGWYELHPASFKLIS